VSDPISSNENGVCEHANDPISSKENGVCEHASDPISSKENGVCETMKVLLNYFAIYERIDWPKQNDNCIYHIIY
jgi:hypothetical protein